MFRSYDLRPKVKVSKDFSFAKQTRLLQNIVFQSKELKVESFVSNVEINFEMVEAHFSLLKGNVACKLLF